jgi:hypothetical protein
MMKKRAENAIADDHFRTRMAQVAAMCGTDGFNNKDDMMP